MCVCVCVSERKTDSMCVCEYEGVRAREPVSESCV